MYNNCFEGKHVAKTTFMGPCTNIQRHIHPEMVAAVFGIPFS